MALPHRGYRRLTGAALVAALAAVAVAGCEAPLGLGEDYSRATCEDVGDSGYREDMSDYMAERVLPASPASREEVAGRVNGRLELACTGAPGDKRPFDAVVAESIKQSREQARASAQSARRSRRARNTARSPAKATAGQPPETGVRAQKVSR